MTWMLRRDPMGDLRGVQDEFNRFFGTVIPRLMGAEEGLVRGNWNPAVDIYEHEDSFVLEADLPGLEPGDFNLSIENYVLTLKGERKFEKKAEGENFHRVERAYGSFTRTFTLPSTISVDDVEAEFKNGVLRVRLPKREEVKPRQIEIAVKTDAEGKKVKAAEAK